MLTYVSILFLKWAGTDSNRRSREATDLQSARFNHLPTYPVHLQGGLVKVFPLIAMQRYCLIL